MNIALFKEIRAEICRTKKPVTYKFIWNRMDPNKNQKWRGNNCQRAVMVTLGEISDYCREKNFPVMSAAVVRQNGSASDKAKSHLFDYNSKIGRVDIRGHTSQSYFYKQQMDTIAWACGV